jgi:hypothetical protein
MPRLPVLYTARSDVAEADLPRVEAWYANRHGPDLIRAGFYTATVYYSEIGAPLVMNLYEVPSPEIFTTPAYREVAARDTEGPAIIALLTSRSNTMYDQVVTVGVPPVERDWAAGGRAGAVDAEALTTVRFDLPEADEPALLRWYQDHEFPRLRRRRGFRAGRLCRRGPPHPVAASHDPRWLVVNEWTSLAEALDDGSADEATGRHADHLGDRLGRLAYNVGRRHLRLTRP